MTLRKHGEAPCWEIHDKTTGHPREWDSGDGWAHFGSREEAEDHIDVRDRDWLVAALSFPGPCLALACDGCGEHFDFNGEGATHLDPQDPTPFDLADSDWIKLADGRHFCEQCWSAWPWCDDCDERHPPGAHPDEQQRKPSDLLITDDGHVLDVPLFDTAALR